MQKKYLLVVIGSTASGKTKLAIQLAQKYNTEIISADSRQIYKGLKIGTAQPTLKEQTLAKHHLINFVDLDKIYTVADYVSDAMKILKELFVTKNTVILCGGTGLYINSLCFGIDDIPEISTEVRNKVRKYFKDYGLEYCVEKLKEKDKNCDKNIDIKNPRRVMRSLEVILETDKPMQYFYSDKKKNNLFEPIFININMNKDLLYSRIDKRVDEMIRNGLVEETKHFEKYKNCNSMQTIGYKEIFEYLDGKISLNDAIEQIKNNTHHYAKRQITWFKKLKNDKNNKIIDYNCES